MMVVLEVMDVVMVLGGKSFTACTCLSNGLSMEEEEEEEGDDDNNNNDDNDAAMPFLCILLGLPRVILQAFCVVLMISH